jgi:hypothetical protein
MRTRPRAASDHVVNTSDRPSGANDGANSIAVPLVSRRGAPPPIVFTQI